jgi:hypothetical protein
MGVCRCEACQTGIGYAIAGVNIPLSQRGVRRALEFGAGTGKPLPEKGLFNADLGMQNSPVLSIFFELPFGARMLMIALYASLA